MSLIDLNYRYVIPPGHGKRLERLATGLYRLHFFVAINKTLLLIFYFHDIISRILSRKFWHVFSLSSTQNDRNITSCFEEIFYSLYKGKKIDLQNSSPNV